MKRERWISCLIGGCLAFMLSFGSVGCLVTGFSLDVTSLVTVGVACALFGLGSSLCFQLKRGGTILLCILALAGGFLWRGGSLTDDISTLLYEITGRYHRAYGWGALGQKGAGVDTAVLTIGCFTAICVSRTICRRKNAVPAVAVSLLPLLSCLVVTDTVPAEGFLFLLLLGLIVLMLTNSLRRSAPMQANTLTAMVSVPVALALGALFLAVPKSDYVNQTEELQDKLLQWAQSIPELMEELSEDVMSQVDGTVQIHTVDLRNQGPQKQYTYPVMDVAAAQTGTLYLREQDYDGYDGTGWTATIRRAEEFALNEELDWVNLGVVTICTRRIRDVLYYPYYPGEAVTLIGGSADNQDGISVYEVMQRGLPADWRQRVSWTAPESTGTVIADVGTVPISDTQRYKNLPNDTRKWAQELLEGILTDEHTATEKAETIAAYVRRSAAYDLNTGKMPGYADDFAVWFLEDSDTGYCVHFATATAVLLRAAGIQSRYVTGYMAYGVKGQTVTVTAAEAHAWVEYYEPILGVWIPLESTPGEGLTQAPAGTAPEETGDTTSAQTESTQPIETEPQETGGSSEKEEDETAVSPIGGDGTGEENRDLSWLGTLLVWILIPGTVVAVAVLQQPVRVELRRRKRERGRANVRALAMWQEALLYGKLLKQPVPGRLEQLAQKAKFSQHILRPEELAEFENYLGSAQEQCRGKPWYLRFLCRYVLALY